MSNPYIGEEPEEQNTASAFSQQKTLEPDNHNPFGSSVPSQQQKTKTPRNILAILALVVAALGLVFACIPGTLLIGVVLLPIAFVMALVSFFLDGTKGFSVAAVLVSIIGAVAAALIFSNGTDSADSEASPAASDRNPALEELIFGDSGTATGSQETTSGDATGSATNSRDNPYPVGSAITEGDWTVTVNEVTLDATQAVLDEDEFNDPPPAGSQYLMVNITALYEGADPQGETPSPRIEYVTASGNTINDYDHFAYLPESEFNSGNTLYQGASTTGNLVFAVPTEDVTEGVLAIRAHVLGDDKIFVDVQ